MLADTLDATTDDVRDFLDLTAQRDDLRGKLALIEEERGKVEARLVERFALNGVQNMKVNGATMYLNVDVHASVPPERREAALAAARSLGLDDLISLQPQRFAAWCREQLRDETTGGRLPREFEGLVNVYERPSLRVRRN